MRRFIPLIVCGFLALGGSAHAQQESSTSIIAKAIKAYGGQERFDKLKARSNKTKGTLHLPATLPFTQEVFYQVPGKIKEVMHVEINGKKTTIVTIFDGENGWIQIDGQLKETSDKHLDELKESAHVVRVTRLVDLKDKAFTLTPLDEIDLDGLPAAGVNVASKGFRDIKLYFDKKSGLVVKTERKAMDVNKGQLVNEESVYSDWKEIEGLMTPMKVTIKRDGRKFIEAEASEVKFLEKLDPSVFAKP